MLETVLVVAVVSMAAGYVLRRAWRTVRKSRSAASGCGECGCESPARRG